MSDKKRERELQEVLHEVETQLESLKKRTRELRTELEDIKKIENPNIPLSHAKSKEQALGILNTWDHEKIKMSEYDQRSLQTIIDNTISNNEKTQDCNCAIYYRIGTYFHVKLIPYDEDGKWEKKCEEWDAKKDWVQIYAK